MQKNGPSMMAMGKPAHTKSNDSLQEEMRQRFLNQEIQEKMKGNLIEVTGIFGINEYNKGYLCDIK